jgi:hypothetical protein
VNRGRVIEAQHGKKTGVGIGRMLLKHARKHHPLVGGRALYLNAVLLAVGFASWLLVMTAGSAAAKPGEDFEEPLAMGSGIFIYVVMANVGYTLGWVVDTVFYNGRPRRRLYKSGLILAVVFTALPGV